jgi:hypothetical protein
MCRCFWPWFFRKIMIYDRCLSWLKFTSCIAENRLVLRRGISLSICTLLYINIEFKLYIKEVLISLANNLKFIVTRFVKELVNTLEGVPCLSCLFTVCFAVSICLVQGSRKQDRGFCVMGCSSSIGKRQPTLVNESPIDIPLSKAQKYLVRETWETVEPHKSNVGKQTFLRWVVIAVIYGSLIVYLFNLKKLVIHNIATIFPCCHFPVEYWWLLLVTCLVSLGMCSL